MNLITFRTLLKSNISQFDYNIYLKNAEIDIYKDNINIYVLNNFSKQRIEDKYINVIKKLESLVQREIFIIVV